MRIGTWNLAGRWSSEHASLLLDADCDVWLLTEVSDRTALPAYAIHRSQSPMASHRHWAGIASRLPMSSCPDPHPASAAVRVEATTYVSSVLPWRACGSRPPWVGDRHADKTRNAVDDLLLRLRAGSKDGRAAILAALVELGLMAPTTDLPHAIEGC